MTEAKRYPFKPRARLLLLLGDQLIRNESIALFELVKNAYDADATFARVILSNVDDPDKGQIIIEDDGTGMDLDTILNVWMEPGTDYRKKEFEERKMTPKYGRLPIGEKGIGRFAAHKLGRFIEMVTRKEGHKEIMVKIDWKAFETSKYLEDVKIDIYERESQVFKEKRTGTRIKVTNLRKEWSRGDVREAHRSIVSITSPFGVTESFKPELICEDKPDWLRGLLKPEEVLNYALFSAVCTLQGNRFDMKYTFTPWEFMDKISPRKKEGGGEINNPENRKKKEVVDLSEYEIGLVKVELYIYDRDPRILKLGAIDDVKGLREYLDRNGGIRVYRNGVRVYDYGESGNDWLNLGMRRVNVPAERISNNIVLGAVFINREESTALVEKTNREGFVETKAYEAFRKAVLYAITQVETERNIDKLRIRDIYGPASKSEPVHEALESIRERINENISDEKLKRNLNHYLDRAEKEYKEITEILLTGAGAGLSLSIVIHEFEKIVKELERITEKETVPERIVKLVKRLSELLEGYTMLVRRYKVEDLDLKVITKQALFNVEYRLAVHGIEVIDGYSGFNKNSRVDCSRRLVLGALMNLIDNSIWWLDEKYGELDMGNKKLYIGITDEISGGISIVVADNGPGFTIPPEYAVRPFITKKPDGMGLGLHIADEVMKAQGGRLIFPEKGDILLPEGMDGAVVALLFRRGKNEKNRKS